MPSNAVNTSNDGASLSLRLSCDRCRIQKLKCSVPTGSSDCQRCTRARVSCVFGRRAPSKRTNKPIYTPTELTTFLRIDKLGLGILLRRCRQHRGLNHLEHGSWNFQAPWENACLGLQGAGPNVPEYDTDMLGCDWIHLGTAFDEGNLFELGNSDLTQWSQLATNTAAASWRGDSSMSMDPPPSNVKNSSAVQTSQRLTTLVSEIQQQLRKLEEGPWHADSACSLDDYPVGTIIELSQQFSAIAGPILGSTVFGGGALEVHHPGEPERNITDAVADTPTMLLVMCGYMWLVRTYGVVLGHFHTHLNVMPTGCLGETTGTRTPIGGSGTIPIGSMTGSALRLSELPCTDTALGLQQIHTAVRLLFDVLHDIENHLGREAVMVRDMAVALLLQSGKLQDISSNGLGKKATAVRELLREKMGL
ncbi:uncharacterized protein N7498_005523 [Penicillium cinerascens]|uniref:Zn(2)-C6 fungal-type domain-containing protein n=1 Tax=Penicillium cinerascens TaxID=70096 RepID=A0A9W9MNL4_9EURO|nr:uncharacterized protein N7498_005523 [Penicillium cinerascens]KAJ5204644.1 hypothetical protein N7498_005523 [Penicillium cinerascens]